MINVKISGMDELKKVIRQNPEVVKKEAKAYFVRSLASLKSSLGQQPWRVSGSNGGVPIDTKYLRKFASLEKIQDFKAIIFTDTDIVPYGLYVHEGTRKMKARPYYEAAKEKSQNTIKKYQENLIDNVVKALAK